MVLIVVGTILILIGLYNAFGFQDVMKLNAIELTTTEDMDNQIFGMIGLGIITLLAGALLTMKRK